MTVPSTKKFSLPAGDIAESVVATEQPTRVLLLVRSIRKKISGVPVMPGNPRHHQDLLMLVFCVRDEIHGFDADT